MEEPEFGTIIVHRHYVDIAGQGKEIIFFEWKGPPVARINWDATGDEDRRLEFMKAQEGDILEIGPYTVRVIERDPSGYLLVARCDSIAGGYKLARGVLADVDCQEPSEVIIRRMRDNN